MDAKLTGKFIKKKRKEMKLSQAELGQKLYVEPQTISKWERGQGMPDIYNADELVKILGCTLDDLFNPQFEEPITALTVCESDTREDYEEVPNTTAIRKIFDDSQKDDKDDKSESKKKFKFTDMFNKKKFSEKIRDRFGVEYENVYNTKFLFKGIFKKRSKKDYENTLSQGLYRDRMDRTTLGITAPWLYLRVFFFLMICAVIGFVVSFMNYTPIYAVVFGSLCSVIPLIVFLFESNFSRDISIFDVAKIFMLGGVASLLLALVLFQFLPANSTVVVVLVAPLVEEIAKFTIAVIFVSILKPKSILSGLLIGFAVGGGFAVFETMQYGINYFLAGLVESEGSLIDGLTNGTWVTMLRTFLSFFAGHHYWTGLATAIYVMTKKNTKFDIRDVFNYKTLLGLLGATLLHMVWNGSAHIPAYWATVVLQILVSVVSVTAFIMIINIGIAEVKILAIYDASEDAKEDSVEEPTTENSDESSDSFESEPIID